MLLPKCNNLISNGEEQMNDVPTTPKKKRNCTTRNRPSGLTYAKTVRPKLGHYKKTVEKLEAFQPVLEKMCKLALDNPIETAIDIPIRYAIPLKKCRTLKKIELKFGVEAKKLFKSVFTSKQVWNVKKWENCVKKYGLTTATEHWFECIDWEWSIKLCMIILVRKLVKEEKK
jgi:hypothetical protein